MEKEAAGVSSSSCALQTAAGDGDTHHPRCSSRRSFFPGLRDAISAAVSISTYSHMDGENYAPLLATITKMTSIKLVRLLKKKIIPKQQKWKSETDAVWWNGNIPPPTHPSSAGMSVRGCGSDRSGIIRDLPLMPQICAGCSSGASTPPPPLCCFVFSVLTGGQLPAKL